MTFAQIADRDPEELVGLRFHNEWLDKSFTVIGIRHLGERPMYALLQYDDGRIWEEVIGVDGFDLHFAEVELLGQGPTAGAACDEHEWVPSMSDIWDEWPGETRARLYHRFVRCARCGLSGDTVRTLGLGEPPPTRCGSIEGTS